MNTDTLLTNIIKLEDMLLPQLKQVEADAKKASMVKDLDLEVNEERVLLKSTVSANRHYANCVAKIDGLLQDTVHELQQLVDGYINLKPSTHKRLLTMSVDNILELAEVVNSTTYYDSIHSLLATKDITSFKEEFNTMFELANLKFEQDAIVPVDRTAHSFDPTEIFTTAETEHVHKPIAYDHYATDVMTCFAKDYAEGVDLEVFTTAVKAFVVPLNYLIVAKV